MKIKEIYISEGLLGNMARAAGAAVARNIPAGLRQAGANRQAAAGAKTLSDAAWKQWTNRVAQILRAQKVRSAAEIPEDQYREYLEDFVGTTFLRGDLDRYDAATQNRIGTELNKIAQARGSAGQVRSLFQELGTQALVARQPRRNQMGQVDTRGMDPETARMAKAFAAAQQATGAAQPQASDQPQSQATPGQPRAAAQPAGGWVDSGQGLYLKPATATTPTMASYRKNIFSLTDQGQWLDARDKPVPQTWQAFLNQALERL